MSYISHLNPGPGLADFWSEIRRPTPYRWPILIVSALITTTLLYAFTSDVWYAPPEKPRVIYISTFAPGRSDAEIEASNLANQKKQDELRAEQAKRDEERKEIYRALGRATGLDVDEMERQIAKDEAQEKAAEDARMRRMLGKDAPQAQGGKDAPVADGAK
ncbi:MAG: hypothetical protein IE933_13260 [Sphingomonadales bacterium]|nr:hypothetical protein [Sphingomonadales bacterium]MBD3774135.1 hypothetical protein [Paracoccaceae bacterium]